jgi:hypothetical protein
MFKVLALILCLLPSLGYANKPEYEVPSSPQLGSMPPDGWGGYRAHIGYSAAFGLASRTFVFKDPVKAWALAMVPGVVKEIQDYHKETPGYRHGLFSRKDLISDAVGAAIGVAAGNLIAEKTGDRYRLTYFKEF